MKKKLAVLVALASVAGVQGCALQADTQGEPRTEPVYITGSNIARKTHSGEVSVMSAEAYEQARMGHNPGAPLTAGSH
jgi:hypothetical protein